MTAAATKATEATEATEVATWARKARDAIERRNAAIRRAHDAGMSLRTIAEAAGLTHAGVARIVKRATV